MLRVPRTLATFLAAGLCGAFSGVACDEECTRGSEGCRCTAAGECVTGLACLSEFCVDPEDMVDDGASQADDDGATVDNVAACEDFVDAFQCGTSDLGQFVMCDSYATAACDLTAYFDCLTEHTGCNAGNPDTSGWMQCTDLGTCS